MIEAPKEWYTRRYITQPNLLPKSITGVDPMRPKADALPPAQVDPKLLHWLFYVDHFCLIAAAITALLNLLPGAFTSLQKVLRTDWLNMRSSLAVITLCAVTSLFLSEETQTARSRRVGRIFGVLTATLAAATFLSSASGASTWLIGLLNRNQVHLLPGSLQFTTAAFFLAGLTVMLVSSRGPVLGSIGDGFAILLSALALSLVTEILFERVGVELVSGLSITNLISMPAICCIVLISLVAILRRAEHGFLSIFWGFGTGSRIARMLAPIILFFPFVREILRAHMLHARFIPSRYAVAVVTSIGTILGFILVLFLARLINRMQENIQGLTLKDELTGLHSVRGFYLLAEQSFRSSQRNQEPFGVLFVDMDNLKIINDRLGHSAGSVSLVETAKLLLANFRETDVIGRLGGDEFVVAGSFNRRDLESAVERLREAVARKNQAAGMRFSISLSIGYAVTDDFSRDSLRSLVTKADQEMYKEKSIKKERRHAPTLTKREAN